MNKVFIGMKVFQFTMQATACFQQRESYFENFTANNTKFLKVWKV